MDDDDELARIIVAQSCPHCGASMIDCDACPSCGRAWSADDDADEEEGSFEVRLTFSVESCPDCELPGPAGACTRCGAEVPVGEPGDAEQRRHATFAPLAERAAAIVRRLDDLPDGHVPITTRQFARVLTDADIFSIIERVIGSINEIGAKRVDDALAESAEAPAEFEALLADAELLGETALRVAWFAPVGPSDEVRTQLIAVAKLAAEIGRDALRILAAESWADAEVAMQSLQRGFVSTAVFSRFSAALADVDLDDADDIDTRIGLVLGRPGAYTNESGAIDVGLLFGAGGGTQDGLAFLGDAAGAYFGHLLRRSDHGSFEQLGLLLNAVTLASVERPVPAHTTAALSRELLDGGLATHDARARAAIERYAADGGRVFDAAMRAQREVRLLLTAELDGPEDVVVGLVSAYRRVSEGPFRAAARLLDDLHHLAVDEAKAAKRGTTVGALARRLSDRDDELSGLVANATDHKLRNAEAHEDFRVDPETLDVVFGDRRLTIQELGDAIERLTSTTAAIEAAVMTFALDEDLASTVTAWMAGGDRPAAIRLVVAAAAGALGFQVTQVDVGTRTRVLLDGTTPTREKALSIMVSVAGFVPQADVLVVEAGGRVVTADAAPFRRWLEAPEAVKDLILLECQASEAIHAGADERDVYRRVLRLRTVLVFSDAAARLKERNTLAERRRVFERLRFVTASARAAPAEVRESESALIGVLRRAEAQARRSTQTSTGQHRIVSALEPIAEFIDNMSVEPFLEN